jgi:hypothetical protein
MVIFVQQYADQTRNLFTWWLQIIFNSQLNKWDDDSQWLAYFQVWLNHQQRSGFWQTQVDVVTKKMCDLIYWTSETIGEDLKSWGSTSKE